ncbi:MAG: hypothetical protein ACYDA1_04235 [Vulcanimicrobiaceae bacterium]
MILRVSSFVAYVVASCLCVGGLFCVLTASARAQDDSSAASALIDVSCGASEGQKSTASSPGTSTLDIGYRNISSKRIVRIEWAFVVNEKIAARVTDTSTLAPRAIVEHYYQLAYDIFSNGRLLGDTKCRALSVEFADGTFWAAPRPPMQLRAVATPPPGEDLATHMQPDGSNIAVSSCSFSVNESRTPVTSTVDIAYTNTAARATSRVDWGLAAEGTIYEKFADTVPVAPSASVDHRFHIPGNVLKMNRPPGAPLLHVKCFVLHVRYADGTQWPLAP